jgi:hypothetical protein
LLFSISDFCADHPDPEYDDQLELVRLLLSVPRELRLTHSARETFEETAAPWPPGSDVRKFLESLVDMEELLLSKLLFEPQIKTPVIDGKGVFVA